MSTNVEILSNIDVPRNALIAFLRDVGAKQITDPQQTVYALSNDQARIWIYPDNAEPRYPDPAIDTRVETLLGAPPVFRLLLECSRNDGSEELAIDFVFQFAERWPCVVDNLSGLARRIYTVEDMRQLRREGRGLRYDDQFVSLPEDDPGEEFIEAQLAPEDEA